MTSGEVILLYHFTLAPFRVKQWRSARLSFFFLYADWYGCLSSNGIQAGRFTSRLQASLTILYASSEGRRASTFLGAS